MTKEYDPSIGSETIFPLTAANACTGNIVRSNNKVITIAAAFLNDLDITNLFTYKKQGILSPLSKF